MRSVKGSIILVTLTLILAAFPLPAYAYRDSLRVIMVTDDKIYRPDDTIQVEVRVYDKGMLTDADDVNVTLVTHVTHPIIVVQMSRISTGIYQGSYQIQNDDTYDRFTAHVVKGNDSGDACLNIDVTHDWLELDIHFANQPKAFAWPGDDVTATLTTTYRRELVDVEDFTLLRLVDPLSGATELTSSRISQGVYEVTCPIPKVRENRKYELEAQATYNYTYANANAFITVNVLTVWYKLDSIAGNTVTFTLGVANEKGNGVENAAITIFAPRYLTGSTNEDGTAKFSMTDIESQVVQVRGKVTSQGRNQSFKDSLYMEDPFEIPDPLPYGFDVAHEGSELFYRIGDVITRGYKAYNSTVPLQNTEIYYYITLEGMDVGISNSHLQPIKGGHPDGAVLILESGVVTTDQFGDFSISFNPPFGHQGNYYIHFEAGIPRHQHNYNPPISYDHDDGLVYEEDMDTMFVSEGNPWNEESIVIESDPLIVGGVTKITIKIENALDYKDELFSRWMPGMPTNAQYMDTFESDWVCWVEGGNRIFFEKTDDEKEYIGYAIIPEFIAMEENFTIVAGSIDGATGYPYINQITLKGSKAVDDKSSGANLLPILAALSVLILIIIALGAFVVKKRRL